MSDQDKETKDPFASKTAAKKTSKKKTAAKKATTKTTSKKDKPKDFSKFDVIILNDDGTDEVGKFSIVRVTSKAVILKRNIPDMRSVIIAGSSHMVDLNELKRRPAGAMHFGKPVSAIIAAIELAE